MVIKRSSSSECPVLKVSFLSCDRIVHVKRRVARITSSVGTYRWWGVVVRTVVGKTGVDVFILVFFK